MLPMTETTVTNLDKMSQGSGKIWSPLRWCLPALVGFLLFLLAFPIDRRIPHWFPLNFAEIFTLWFLFVTPVTTVIAIVALLKAKRAAPMALFATLITWAAIGVSLVTNVFVLLGMWASTY
jgi:hypothetical protein